jgi:ubiquinone/menaquinone biosynthesis C-methylase UbiE
MTYSRWQYEKGGDTIKFFLEFADEKQIFDGKTVVDIGCGAAGKTMYYAGLGVKKIYGIEVLEKYRREAEELAAELGAADKFEFICADGAQMPFENNSIDTIIMNDAMEHVDEPQAVLTECLRVLAPGGRVYINFPPYYHPYGAHLSDVLAMPWVHLLFSDKTLIRAYKQLAENLPDGEARIAFRISKDEHDNDYFSYINKMKVKRFRKMLKDMNLTPIYYHEAPLRGFLTPLAKIPAVKELFVKMVVCIIEKEKELGL